MTIAEKWAELLRGQKNHRKVILDCREMWFQDLDLVHKTDHGRASEFADGSVLCIDYDPCPDPF